MTTTENALARWLRESRKPQTEVWKALGVMPSVVSKWVSGRGRPGLAHAMTLEKLSGGRVPAESWLDTEERAKAEALSQEGA